MKKRKILIIGLVIIILFLIILILSIYFSKLEKIKISNFIDNYNLLLKKNIDKNVSIRYPKDNDKFGAAYFVLIKNNIYLGVANENVDGTIDLNNDNVAATLLRYDKDIVEYEEINNYLFYLIKANNNKISDKNIKNIIKKLREKPDSTIKQYNLIIKHNSLDYQTDSVGRVEK